MRSRTSAKPSHRARPRRRQACRRCSAGATSWPARAGSGPGARAGGPALARDAQLGLGRGQARLPARQSPCACAGAWRGRPRPATPRAQAPETRGSRASWRSRPFWRSMCWRRAPGSWATARCVAAPAAPGRATGRRRSSPDGVSGECGGA
jgi:hypothetical protein